MTSPDRTAAGLLEALARCPDCRTDNLAFTPQSTRCRSCGAEFPMRNGVPVLIRADNDVFPRAAYAAADRAPPRAGWRLSETVPWRSVNLAYRKNLARFVATLAALPRATVLVVGSGDQRSKLRDFFAGHPQLDVCYSDVDVHASVDVFCDAHELPFRDRSFDGVIASAVLEHVLYPEQVIGEIHRVLRDGGLVYSEVPFMQQVHEGAYDFTRYTLSGHRRAFNAFEELASGVVAGPGTTLLWAMEHFLRSFVPGRMPTRLASFGVRTLFFWVKYFDYALGDSAAAADGASCTYFLGRKTAGHRASDRGIIERYHGRQRLRHL